MYLFVIYSKFASNNEAHIVYIYSKAGQILCIFTVELGNYCVYVQ